MDRYMLAKGRWNEWYVIPASMEKEFRRVTDGEVLEQPEWAKPVHMLEDLTFTDPSW